MNHPLRFQADANFNLAIVRGLRRIQPAIDFQSAGDAGILNLPDPEVLVFAAQEQRVLVSHDVRTMPGHFTDFLASGQHSPGIVLIRQTLSMREAIEWLHLAWQAIEAAEWLDLITFLP
jgi:predicted nuclease of predicted toxin-antitoxin system